MKSLPERFLLAITNTHEKITMLWPSDLRSREDRQRTPTHLDGILNKNQERTPTGHPVYQRPHL